MYYTSLVASVALACDGVPAAHEPSGFAESTSSLRPDDRASGDMYTYDANEVVERWDSPGGSFRVHFTRAGRNAVPVRDNDADGTPDFVEEVGAYADAVDTFFAETLQFSRARDDSAVTSNGGDGRFDFYLVDFGGSGDGAYRTDLCDGTPRTCTGHMVIENDYAGYGYPSSATAHAILVSHEYFHAIQAAYSENDGADGESVLREGSAVWATEQYDPNLNDFEGFIDGYLDRPDRSLDKPLPGPVDAFSYGGGLFFQYLGEKYGVASVRKLWERRSSDARWLGVLATLLDDDYDTTFGEVFTTFVRWNLFTGTFADGSKSYARGGRYPRLEIEDEALPLEKAAIRLSYASSQSWAVEGGGSVTVRVVPAVEDARSAEGLAMFVSLESGGRIVELVEMSPIEGNSREIDASSANRVVFTLVNRDVEGEWRRPTLCAGSASDVEACVTRATVVPDAGSVDVPDAGEVTVDAGDGSGGEVPGCGCAGGEWSSFGLLLGVATYRRRRR